MYYSENSFLNETFKGIIYENDGMDNEEIISV